MTAKEVDSYDWPLVIGHGESWQGAMKSHHAGEIVYLSNDVLVLVGITGCPNYEVALLEDVHWLRHVAEKSWGTATLVKALARAARICIRLYDIPDIGCFSEEEELQALEIVEGRDK